MRQLYVFLFIACAFILAGCEDESEQQVQFGETFTLWYGETASVDTEEMISISLAHVEDTRCPADVVCVSPGEVKVSFVLNYAGESKEVVLSEGGAGIEQYFFGDAQEFSLDLLSVVTEPAEAMHPHKLSDYAVELVVRNDAPACTAEYNPQCGLKAVTCVTSPCQPVYETFGNLCALVSRNASLAFSGQCGDLEGVSVPIKPDEPVFCIEIFDPVCGIVGTEIQRYSNSCFAEAAGAIVIHDELCLSADVTF